MSLEETRETAVSAPTLVVPALATDSAPAEKPKTVRRRVVKPKEGEQPTISGDAASGDAVATEIAAKPKRAPRRVAASATKNEGETRAPDHGSVAPASTAPSDTNRSAPVAKAPDESPSVRTDANADGASDFRKKSEQDLALENNSRDMTHRGNGERGPSPRDNASRENLSRDNSSRDNLGQDNAPRENFGRHSPRDNTRSDASGRDNGGRDNNRSDNRGDRFSARENNEAGENGAPFGANSPGSGENRSPNGDNGAGERAPEDDRFEGRLRFRGNRNGLRRERGQNRNGRFGGQVGGENGFQNPQQRRREVEILALQNMEMPELAATATEFAIENPPEEKDALIYAILEAQAHLQNAILKRGTLEILGDGKGFLRCEGYLPADGDVYVSQSQIKRFNLKTGDLVLGTVRTPKEMERFHGLLRVEAINGLSPEVMKTRKDFEKLTPIFPTEKFVLETEATNITARIIDLISPIGKGSRGLIVAPPKAGKTTLIKNIANSIALNHPEVVLIVLLIDERPEEVTDISRSIKGEVVASTFDEMPDNHMRVADIVMEKAKRLVEMKQDVVILMDSITRLSRASNLVVAPSGRTLSGGLDPAAMYRPKRMFGAARNIEEGGSLTILATALVDTGSRMDEMIFEEFKGTGNLDLVLDRNLFDQRIFPAIDINRSGTRRDDLLLGKEDLATIFHLRRTLAQLDNDKAVTLLIDRLKNTKSNLDFMGVVAKSARNTGQGAG